MDGVLQTMERLPAAAEVMMAKDWQELARASGDGSMARLFYDEEGQREARILTDLGEDDYEATWKRVLRGEGLLFRDIGCLLALQDEDGQAMKKVMGRVVDVNRQKSEKTQLREGLMSRILRQQLGDGEVEAGEAKRLAEEASMMIERLVVEAVWENRGVFRTMNARRCYRCTRGTTTKDTGDE